MRLRWLGTAGFEMRSGDTTILVDPYLSRNPRAVPRQTLSPDVFTDTRAVLVTHGHFDHNYEVPEIVKISGASVYASTSVCEALAKRGVPRDKLVEMRPGESAGTGPFRITGIPACHVTFDIPLVLSTLKRCIRVLPKLARLGPPRFPTGGQREAKPLG